MKMLFFYVLPFSLAALSFALMDDKREDLETETQRIDKVSEPVPSLSEAKNLEPFSGTRKPSAEGNQTPYAKGGREFSEAAFLEDLAKTDLARTFETAKLVEKLEDEWTPAKAQFLRGRLHAIGETDIQERGRIIFLANEVRSKDLEGFWTDVLTRKVPAFENEAELLGPIETNLSSMILRNELSAAVRNLGWMGFKEESAVQTLETYVKASDPTFNNTMARKDAYYRIREIDPVRAARSLAHLSPSDPLKSSLALD